MKIQVIFLTISIICNVLCKVDKNFTFTQFQNKFGKKYKTEKQRGQRKINFQRNLKILLKASQNNSMLGPNQYMDMSPQQQKKFFNLGKNGRSSNNKLVSESIQNIQSTFNKVSSSGIPSYFNYLDLQKVSSTKHQLNCGSCWAFAAAANYQSQVLLQKNLMSDSSEEYILDCILPDVNIRCSGLDTVNATTLLNQTGAALQSQYPYKSGAENNYTANGMCTNTSSYLKLISPMTQIISLKQIGMVVVNQSTIINYLLNYGPLSVGIYSNQTSFRYLVDYPYEVNDCPSNAPFDHAVSLIGYTPTHYIIKNSWGTGWGNLGIGKISRTNDCGIRTYVDLVKTGMNFSSYPNVTIKLSIAMFDTKYNGWGWLLGFRQNGTIVQNFTLARGGIGNAQVTISAREVVQIVVLAFSNAANSTEISFTIKTNVTGYLLFNQPKGVSFNQTPGAVLGTFCPSYCPLASGAVGSANDINVQSASDIQGSPQSHLRRRQSKDLSKLEISLIAVSSSLLFLLILSMIVVIYLCKTRIRRKKHQQSKDVVSQKKIKDQSAKNSVNNQNEMS